MKFSYCIDGVFQIRNNSLQNSTLFENDYVASQYDNGTSVSMTTVDSSMESWYNSNLTSTKIAELNSSNDYRETSSLSPFTLTAYTLVFVFGVVGNLLVVATLRSSPNMRTVTNCFLLSLSISDGLQALICIPIGVVGQTLERFIFGEIMCRVFVFLMGMSVSVSTFTMTAISLERYHAICKPLKSRHWQTKSHAYKVIGSIWVLSLIIMSPYFIYSKLDSIPVLKLKQCTLACRMSFGANDEHSQKIWYTFLILTLFLIPGIFMAGAYFMVCRQIFKGFQFYSKTPLKNQSTISLKTMNRMDSNRDDDKYTDSRGTYRNDKLSCLRNKQSLDIPGQNSSQSRKSGGQLNRQRSMAYQSKSQLESKKKVVRMLIVVVVFFFICWAPLFIINVWKGYEPKKARKSISKTTVAFIQLLSYVSSCINPIIYCFMNLKFRQSFVKAFTCCLPTKCYNNIRRNIFLVIYELDTI